MRVWLPAGYTWREHSAYALLFLFPIAALTMRHWLSTIFTLLCLAALFALRGRRCTLSSPERRLLWLFAALFGAFVLSNLVNGWGEDQTSSLGVEIRYLLFIPLYLYLRDLPHAGPTLLKGSLVGALVLGGQAVYETWMAGAIRVEGAYGPLILGGFAVLLMSFSAIAWRVFRDSPWRWLAVPAFFASWFALAASGTRGAYVAAVVMLFVAVGLRLHRRGGILALFIAAGLVWGTYSVSDVVASRVNSAVNEVTNYFSIGDPAAHKRRLSSSGIRLELWRAGWLMFKEHPVLGVGSDNFESHIARQASARQVNRHMGAYSHAHSVYVHLLATKGLLGTALYLAIFIYAAWMFIAGRRVSRRTAALGLFHLAGIAALGLTEAAPAIKGNYLALFLLYLAAFLAWHMRVLESKGVSLSAPRRMAEELMEPRSGRTCLAAGDGNLSATHIRSDRGA